MDAATAGLVANAVSLVTGIGIGLGAGYALFPAIREAKVLREQLDAALKEHEEYKASVDSHFRKTADLVGQMTRSYAAVYDHLAVGARTFCDDAAAGSKVGFGPLPGTLASPDIEAAAEAAESAEATGDAAAAPLPGEDSAAGQESDAADAAADGQPATAEERAAEPATEERKREDQPA